MKRHNLITLTALLLAILIYFLFPLARLDRQVEALSFYGESEYQTMLAVEDIYVAQSALANDCGVDASKVRSVAWFNESTSWGSGDGKIGPGATVHLCGVISTGLNVQGSGESGQPITILFEPDARLSAPVWNKITWGRAAIRTSSVEYIVIDGGVNGVIESTDNGTGRAYHEDQIGIWLYGCNHCEVKNMTVRGMYVRTPLSDDDGSGLGIYASGNYVQIYHNVIAEAQTGIAYNYPGGMLTEVVKIYGNRISRISNGITVGSGNTNALANDFEIYDNDITDGFVWDGIRQSDGHWFHNDGIQVWAVHDGSRFTNLRVHSNYIHGDMGRHITGWIFIEGNVEWPLIFNNVLVTTGTSYPANGMITSSGEIYENTIVTFNPGICINAGTYSRIKNNLLYNCGTAIGIHAPGEQTKIDFNLFAGDPDFAVVNGSGTFIFYSFEDWQAMTFDLQSRLAEPEFVDLEGYNFDLKSTSRWTIDTGTALSSTVSFDKDRLSRPQGGGWDIGAYEFAPKLFLHGHPANQVINLDWTVNVTLPTTTTWRIDYYTPTMTLPFTVTDSYSTTHTYTLTGLTNYEWYTVTLYAMLDNTPWLSDTIKIMPMVAVHLPLILK